MTRVHQKYRRTGLPPLALRLSRLGLTPAQRGKHCLLGKVLSVCHAHWDRGHRASASTSTARRNTPSLWRHVLSPGCLCTWHGRQSHPIHHSLHVHLRIRVLRQGIILHSMHYGRVMWGLPRALRILVLRILVLRMVLLGNRMLRRMMTRLALQGAIKTILRQMHIELMSRVGRRRRSLLRLLWWRMRTLRVRRQWTPRKKRLIM